jgi:hypothetical protein
LTFEQNIKIWPIQQTSKARSENLQKTRQTETHPHNSGVLEKIKI